MIDDYDQSTNETQHIMQKLFEMPKHVLQSKADEFLKKQSLDTRYDGLVENMASRSNGDYIKFNDEWSPAIWKKGEDKQMKSVIIDGQEIKV